MFLSRASGGVLWQSPVCWGQFYVILWPIENPLKFCFIAWGEAATGCGCLKLNIGLFLLFWRVNLIFIGDLFVIVNFYCLLICLSVAIGYAVNFHLIRN